MLHTKTPYKFINNQVSKHSTDDDKMEIKKEITHWYRRNDEIFLGVVVSKYAGKSQVIKQSCVIMRDDNWSILDVMVISGNNGLKMDMSKIYNFYLVKKQMDDDPSEAITNRCKFSLA